ncbi:chemotaxis protein [Noviherbaspirillum aerium]|uniref:chemotaxis protein n=1 Tax=Noviherbaspirillum aerium TaxID=2588497 RepID=UPI00124EB4CF|nr:chemotaxis protein [Noviherbaspirillum aerium]
MSTVQQEVDERTNLTASNKFELLLFRLGGDSNGEQNELYGINVFKIREIVAMPPVTPIAESAPYMMGVVNLRGEILPVIDLPGLIGCSPTTGLNILLVTEFARTTQCFAVEAVDEIVRLDWSQVRPSAGSYADNTVTSIARLNDEVHGTRLVQVLDVETIVQKFVPGKETPSAHASTDIRLPPGAVILAADDSAIARTIIQKGLDEMGLPYIMTKSGKEAWEKLQELATEADKENKTLREKVALVLTDLEMPEMDGFTLTRQIKTSNRYNSLPVLIHSSLSGSANEAHVKSAGANAYVAKFSPVELAEKIRQIL